MLAVKRHFERDRQRRRQGRHQTMQIQTAFPRHVARRAGLADKFLLALRPLRRAIAELHIVEMMRGQAGEGGERFSRAPEMESVHQNADVFPPAGGD